MELYQGALSIGGQSYTFANPELTLTDASEQGSTDGYLLKGTIAKIGDDVDLEPLGFNPPSRHLFALKLTVDGAADSATVKLTGTQSKTITKADFDGPDFVYLVLNGDTSNYSFVVKSSEDAEQASFILINTAIKE